LGGVIETALLTGATFAVPTAMVAAWLRLTGRTVRWGPLLWAGVSFAIYIVALRSRSVLPRPGLIAGLELNWVGKSLSLLSTCAILRLLPSVSFREAGVTWDQAAGSLRPAIAVSVITILSATVASAMISSSPNLSWEWLLFQATMPGLDEELFLRGLMLLLFHQAFGKNMSMAGAETGWGLWLTTVLFGLLHGVAWADGSLQINIAAIVFTGFVGLVAGWIRERTGSLVVPVLFHNVFNVTQAFV
jgi:membrane protease YdiL (CAAX protease family)